MWVSLVSIDGGFENYLATQGFSDWDGTLATGRRVTAQLAAPAVGSAMSAVIRVELYDSYGRTTTIDLPVTLVP